MSGLIGPFYVIQIEKLSGGMEKLGIAFAIMVFLDSLTCYLAGRFSDKLGRKPFLFLAAYLEAFLLICYTLISDTWQLYILQAAFGVTSGIMETVTTSLLGDLTEKEDRGRDVGTFNALVGLASAAGLAIGGFVAEIYGLKSLFYLSASVIAISTFLLFFIRETKSNVDDRQL